MTAVEMILDKLERVTKTSTGWTGRCPTHHDRHSSLSVGVGSDGRVLLRCFAGCGTEAIVASLGLTMSSLFERTTNGGAATAAPPRSRTNLRASDLDIRRSNTDLLGNRTALARLEELRGWTWPAVAHVGVGIDGNRIIFPYRSHDGKLTGVARYAPNPPTRGDAPKTKADPGSKRDLFPGPERMPTGGRWLFLVEGEPDQLRLFSCGVHAVAVPGVQGWRREWAERFRGRRVCTGTCAVLLLPFTSWISTAPATTASTSLICSRRRSRQKSGTPRAAS